MLPKHAAGFALGVPVRREDGYVIRHGKLFEIGDYPDKSFSLTSDEMAAATADFSPVPVDLAHTSTPLDGRLGEVRTIEMGSDGKTLFGDVALPEWLDTALEGTGRKVSATWDRATKRLTGLALVNHPRISDAALMAAFAAFADRHDTTEGQSVMQSMHDMAARSGAICTTENPNGTRSRSSYFVSKHEATGMQAMHDLSCEHGAQCSAIGKTSTYAAAFTALFAGQRHSAGDAKDIQAIHDLAAKQGADCAPAAMSSGAARPGRTRKTMNFKFWEKTTPVERAELRATGVEVPEEATFSELEARVDEKMAEERAAFRKQLRDEQAKRLTSESAAFADGVIRTFKALPAEREALIAAHTQAALDDAEHGAVTFATTGKQGSRVEALTALCEARPAHTLTKEQLKSVDPEARFYVAANAGEAHAPDPEMVTADGKPLSKERKGRLIQFTGIDPQAAQKA